MKKKNKDIEKALKKGSRELEMEIFGPGFHSQHKIHKSKKTYTRKQKHKGGEIDTSPFFSLYIE